MGWFERWCRGGGRSKNNASKNARGRCETPKFNIDQLHRRFGTLAASSQAVSSFEDLLITNREVRGGGSGTGT